MTLHEDQEISRHPLECVSFSECYPQSVDMQSSIPAISSTIISVSEITIVSVGLPVKEACFMWTNIRVSASFDCMEMTMLETQMLETIIFQVCFHHI